MLAVLLALFLVLVGAIKELLSRTGARQRYRRLAPPRRPGFRSRAKPAWVRTEVIRLKALMPEAGCRHVAATFNRRFAAKRKISVGKIFVADTIRAHRYEIAIVRRQIKNARPKRLPRNLLWSVDLSGKTTLDGTTCLILGILELASRAALRLEALPTKSGWALIAKLLETIRRYGRPRALKTDNEAVFTSRSFRFALFVLGIRHQRTDPGCPCQNGRIERFFGTLKEKLDRLGVDSLDALDRALAEFRFFHNHVRPHQHLGGATPAEAWAGIEPFATVPKRQYWFDAWDGLLTGYQATT